MQTFPVDNHLPGRVDDRDLGLRRGPERPWQRVDVRAVNEGAVRREREKAGAPAGGQTLHVLPGGEVYHGNIVADSVRDVEEAAIAVRDRRVRLVPGR